MPYGLLTREQEEILAPFVEGRHVYDLGAGDLTLSRRLLQLGASRVTAIDKEGWPEGTAVPEEIQLVPSYFHALSPRPESIAVAFLSWPANWYTDYLVHLLSKSKLVVYLGINSRERGLACGDRALWRHLTLRVLLASQEHPRNNLLIYGGCGEERELHPEEREALDAYT